MYRTLFALFVFTSPALGSGPETREYRITVDGRAAGTYTMTITELPDGTVEQAGRADVSMRVLLKTFSYSYNGTETWQNGRLVKLQSQANDDGKQYQVQGQS